MTFYNKYRPKTFDNLIQCKFDKSLSHHAYLFFGPPGTGKTSAARLCMAELQTNKSEEKIEACVTGKHPDYHEINCSVNNGVDDIRNLISDVVNTVPVESKFKFIILDESHMLTTQSQNALLKTVEEPPNHIKFIFCTTEINKVLPAIRSRCQIIPFFKLKDESLIKILTNICNGEKLEYNQEAIDLIVSCSDGSARASINLLEQCSSVLSDPIAVSNILGTSTNNNFHTLTDYICKKDRIKSIKLLDEIITNSVDPNSVLNKYADFIADQIVKRLTNPSDTVFSGKSLMLIGDGLNNILKDFKVCHNIKLIGKLYLLKIIEQI